MATNLFNAALDDPALMSEIASVVEQTSGNLDSVEQSQVVVARAASDSQFKSQRTRSCCG